MNINRIGLLLISAVVFGASLTSFAGAAEVETINPGGTPWTAHTWGYSTPKLLFDGKNEYAVGLIGTGPGHDFARLFMRDSLGWHKGADIAPVYQPTTIVLDRKGRINLFCTEAGKQGFNWRSKRPGDVSDFEQIPLPKPEKFSFGYLGAGVDRNVMALVGLDSGYNMWITCQQSPSSVWTEPIMLVKSIRELPRISPVYPIVMPRDKQVYVVYSNSPDGSIHNTYNRVEYLIYDIPTARVVKHEIITDGPIGEYTFGLDAYLAPDGTLYVLHFGGIRVYRKKRADIGSRRGLFCTVIREGSPMQTSKVTDSTGTAQLSPVKGRTPEIFQTTSTGTECYRSSDGGSKWKAAALPAWTGTSSFLYALKPNSGSARDEKQRFVQSTKISTEQGYSFEYIELQRNTRGTR